MNPYYYDELPAVMDDEAAMAVAFVLLGVLGVILLFCLIFWIIRSMSLHAVAKRRGISKAWLSWLPIGNKWILGSLSDQYQHLALGQIKSRRKILLVLELIGFAMVLLAIPAGIAQAVARISGEQPELYFLSQSAFSLVSTAVSIVTLVFSHICNYDLYRSCDPKNAVVYLVIGILIPVTEPFFYLANRKKDNGMPKPEPVEPVL